MTASHNRSEPPRPIEAEDEPSVQDAPVTAGVPAGTAESDVSSLLADGLDLGRIADAARALDSAERNIEIPRAGAGPSGGVGPGTNLAAERPDLAVDGAASPVGRIAAALQAMPEMWKLSGGDAASRQLWAASADPLATRFLTYATTIASSDAALAQALSMLRAAEEEAPQPSGYMHTATEALLGLSEPGIAFGERSSSLTALDGSGTIGTDFGAARGDSLTEVGDRPWFSPAVDSEGLARIAIEDAAAWHGEEAHAPSLVADPPATTHATDVTGAVEPSTLASRMDQTGVHALATALPGNDSLSFDADQTIDAGIGPQQVDLRFSVDAAPSGPLPSAWHSTSSPTDELGTVDPIPSWLPPNETVDPVIEGDGGPQGTDPPSSEEGPGTPPPTEPPSGDEGDGVPPPNGEEVPVWHEPSSDDWPAEAPVVSTEGPATPANPELAVWSGFVAADVAFEEPVYGLTEAVAGSLSADAASAAVPGLSEEPGAWIAMDPPAFADAGSWREPSEARFGTDLDIVYPAADLLEVVYGPAGEGPSDELAATLLTMLSGDSLDLAALASSFADAAPLEVEVGPRPFDDPQDVSDTPDQPSVQDRELGGHAADVTFYDAGDSIPDHFIDDHNT